MLFLKYFFVISFLKEVAMVNHLKRQNKSQLQILRQKLSLSFPKEVNSLAAAAAAALEQQLEHSVSHSRLKLSRLKLTLAKLLRILRDYRVQARLRGTQQQQPLKLSSSSASPMSSSVACLTISICPKYASQQPQPLRELAQLVAASPNTSRQQATTCSLVLMISLLAKLVNSSNRRVS